MLVQADCRSSTVSCVEGLNVDAVLGTDGLLQTRRIALALQEAKGHGVMSLGRRNLIPVETPDGSVRTARAIRAGLWSMSPNHIASSGPPRKGPRVKVTIGWTPVICTLEEESEEPGIVEMNANKAQVVISSDLIPSQRAVVEKLLA